MPMVNGKKYSYTKQGMAAAKKAAAKQKPSKTVRKPGMTNRPQMRKAR